MGIGSGEPIKTCRDQTGKIFRSHRPAMMKAQIPPHIRPMDASSPTLLAPRSRAKLAANSNAASLSSGWSIVQTMATSLPTISVGIRSEDSPRAIGAGRYRPNHMQVCARSLQRRARCLAWRAGKALFALQSKYLGPGYQRRQGILQFSGRLGMHRE